MSRPQRQFTQTSRAWYASTALSPGELDEVRIGVDWVEPEDGCEYEFLIKWNPIGPRIEMYDDAWQALRDMPDVMSWLADHDDEHPTAEAVCEALLAMGFVDSTPTHR